MTEVINNLPGSTFFSIVFFMMLVTLGLSSMFGNLESIVSSIKDMPYFKNARSEVVISMYSFVFTKVYGGIYSKSSKFSCIITKYIKYCILF